MVIQTVKDLQRKKRGRRTKEESVLSLRYNRRPRTHSYQDDDSDTPSCCSTDSTPSPLHSNLNHSSCVRAVEHPLDTNLNVKVGTDWKKEKFSFDDILVLIEEQKSLKEDLDYLARSNFNIENILSNCTLKVEDLNRKLLLVEYGLSDIDNPKMKWEDRIEENGGVYAENLNNAPLKRTHKTSDLNVELPVFDDGRHKLEKYARIHGIVDVEIELYESDDTSDEDEDYEEEEEEEGTEEEVSDEKTFSYSVEKSEKTFSYSVEKPADSGIFDCNKTQDSEIQYIDNKLIDMIKEDSQDNETVAIHDQEPSDNSNSSSDNSKSSSDNSNQSVSEQISYSLVDPDDDIFSDNLSSIDSIERVKFTLGDESSLRLDTLNSTSFGSSTLVDNRGKLVDAGVGDYCFVGCQDTGTETTSSGIGSSTSPLPQLPLTAVASRQEEDSQEVGSADGKEDEGVVRRRREEEDVCRLLEDLEITADDIEKQYSVLPTIRIETGVEEGAPLLREHKDDTSEDRTPTPQLNDDMSATTDYLDKDSDYDFEDSEAERRRRKSERPFPKRSARSFFARLCACWHN